MPSQWLGGQVGTLAESFEEADPLNRTVFLVLMVVAIGILILRSFRWENFIARNLFLVAFLFFALMSASWSDFPLVTSRRWFRDVGSYMAILVALSDPNPLEGVRTLLRRFAYLVIPLSVLLVKYYPEMAIGYDQWTGLQMYVGASTDKNMLGITCLVSGIYFVWDTAMRWSDRAERQTKRILLLNGAFIWMTLWLMNRAHSATSDVCLVIAFLVILLTVSKTFRRHPTFFKVLIPASFCLYVILGYGFNLNAYFASSVGRDPTLTNRTLIWHALLSIDTNPVVGTGYRSFFLGDRLQAFWQVFPGINEAHNGYLDIYLTLGIVGLVLLLAFLVASYGTIWKRFGSSSQLASLGLAVWTTMLFYNVTEAGFDNSLLWLNLMLIGIAVPVLTEERARSETPSEIVVKAQSPKRIPETADMRR